MLRDSTDRFLQQWSSHNFTPPDRHQTSTIFEAQKSQAEYEGYLTNWKVKITTPTVICVKPDRPEGKQHNSNNIDHQIYREGTASIFDTLRR